MKKHQLFDIESLRTSISLDFSQVFADIGFNKEISDLIIKSFTTNSNRKPPASSNKLNRNEFLQLYEKITVMNDEDSGGNDGKRVSDLVFKLFDINHDNYLTIREFLIGIAVSTHGSIKQKVEQAFYFYDFKNNGWITRNDIKKGLKDVYELVQVNEMDEFISGYIDKYAKVMEESDGKISKGNYFVYTNVNLILNCFLYKK
jgi:Ca2+-binding EF-hand superfamily protein